MNVLRKLTIQNIRKNRKRSIVTIIGIMLATALIVAVAGVAASARETIIQFAKRDSGDYHVTYFDVSGEDLSYLENHAGLSHVFVTELLGYAAMPQSVNPDKCYYYVNAMTKEGMEKTGLHLAEGRMPENDGELVISRHIISNAGLKLKVGDTLELMVGKRQNRDGRTLTQNNGFDPEGEETITGAVPYKYTIVGIMERPNQIWEPYSAAGYTVITFRNPEEAIKADGDYAASVNFRTLSNWRDVNRTIREVLKEGHWVDENTQLLRYEGGMSADIMQMITGLAIAVILVIIGTSVFVIRNSFHISVAEKERLYGMLASVGATSRQIRKSVLFEGFLLGLAGIPLGILCGDVAVRVLMKILNVLLAESVGQDLLFVYHIPALVRLGTVVLAAVTIVLSCLMPAVKAGKIAPIDAIRGQGDVAVRRRTLRVSPLLSRILGVGGVIAAKNLKRSRKKYRTTVVSLVVSITVFIMLSGFVGQLKEAVGAVYQDGGYNLLVGGAKNEAVYQKLIRELQPEKYSYGKYWEADIQADPYAAEEMREYAREDGFLQCSVIMVNRDSFREYCKDLGVSEDPSRTVILCGEAYAKHVNGKTLSLVEMFTIKPGETIPVYLPLQSEAAENAGYELSAEGLWQKAEGGKAPAEYEENSSPQYRIGNASAWECYDNEGKAVQKRVDLRVTEITSEQPAGEHYYIDGGMFFLSEDYFEDVSDFPKPYLMRLSMDVKDPYQTEEALTNLIQTSPDFSSLYVNNAERETRQQKSLVLALEIFLYGFILVITLIGVTNIFNTITTNMILRSREFAMLKSVGMTAKEFSRMIRLESVMYGMRSLLFGVPLGILGSVLLYHILAQELDTGYILPVGAVLLSVVFVFLIVSMTMRYSMARINRQNILETIRSENL